MIALACFSVAVVAGVALTQHRRPLAELIVDLLYRRAIRAAALARAADAALVRYRTERDAIQAGHVPMYVEASR